MRRFRHNGRVYLAEFSLAGLLAASGLWMYLRFEDDDPKFEGKRVSAWFDQLFSQEINSNNVPISYAAQGSILRMKADAVPFLATKLKYHPIGDELFVWLKQNWLTRRFTGRMVSPLDRRLTAVGLLGQIGPAASNAVPALLLAWKQDPSKRVRENSVYVLAVVLNNPPYKGVHVSRWPEFESVTIGEAAERYPDIAKKLHVSVQPRKLSEPASAANWSQPVRSETNGTPAEAGSGR